MKPIEIIHDGTKFNLRPDGKAELEKGNRELQNWLDANCYHEYDDCSIPQYMGWCNDDIGYVALMTEELAHRVNKYGLHPVDLEELNAMKFIGEPVMIIWCQDCKTIVGIFKMSGLLAMMRDHLLLLENKCQGVLE